MLNVGLLRANLCERLSRLCGGGTPDTAYTVGLLSVLDAVLARPMQELMDELPLADEVKLAIVHHQGPYGQLLRAVLDLERNVWPKDACPGVDPAVIVEAYAASSEAAFSAMEVLNHA